MMALWFSSPLEFLGFTHIWGLHPKQEHRLLCKEGTFHPHSLLFFPRNCLYGLLKLSLQQAEGISARVKQVRWPCGVSKGCDGDSLRTPKPASSESIASSDSSLLVLCAHCTAVKPCLWGPFFCRIQTAVLFDGSHNSSSAGLLDDSPPSQESTSLTSAGETAGGAEDLGARPPVSLT